MTEQEQAANRAQVHLQFCLGFLSIGDWSSANDYLVDVEKRDGRSMYQSVCDMIALELRIAPKELR
ncbi:hypothetical protein [Kutzneria sp. NPDC052558]|uniref:hypothetical protein n=1 Tax=Kutzneria sp. NPDC052558 TaxID=3364121 RepID=UPI0037C54E19